MLRSVYCRPTKDPLGPLPPNHITIHNTPTSQSVNPSTTQPIIHIKSHYENQLIGFRFVVVAVVVVVASQVSSFLCSVFLFGHSGCAATRVVSFRKSFGMLNASRTFTFLIQSVIGIRSSVRPSRLAFGHSHSVVIDMRETSAVWKSMRRAYKSRVSICSLLCAEQSFDKSTSMWTYEYADIK